MPHNLLKLYIANQQANINTVSTQCPCNAELLLLLYGRVMVLEVNCYFGQVVIATMLYMPKYCQLGWVVVGAMLWKCHHFHWLCCQCSCDVVEEVLMLWVCCCKNIIISVGVFILLLAEKGQAL